MLKQIINFIPNKHTQQQKLERNNQQLIFGSSKFIFYEQSNSNRVAFKRKYSNIGKNHNQKIQNKKKSKVSFSLQRIHTASSKIRQAITKKQFNYSSNKNKNNQNTKINLKFNQSESINIKKISKNYIQSDHRPKTAYYHLKCLQNQYTTRTQVKQMKQNPKIDNRHTLTLPNQQNNIIKLKKQNSKCSNKANILEHQYKNQQLKQVVMNCIEQPQNIKIIQQRNMHSKQQIQHQLQNTQQITMCHQNIKNLFGIHHRYFKQGKDYLNKFKNDQKEVKNIQVIKAKQINQNMIQQNLEEQIEYLSRIYTSPSKFTKSQNQFQKKEKFDGLARSLIMQNKIQRAPIVKYIKNQDHKTLFNILIQVNNQQKYIDKQFSHQHIMKINNQQIQWVYIQPTSYLKLFPSQNKNQNIIINKHDLNKDIPFVSFLKILFLVEPILIKRIFQPIIKNIYSVWLFLNGSFEPIFIDGYFPLDQHLNHLYGNFGDSLWLPILIKCICKSKNTYERQKLIEIKNQQVYKMLTGLQFKTLQLKEKQFDLNINNRIISQLNQGNKLITINLITNEIQIIKFSQIQKNQLLIFNPLTGNIKKFSAVNIANLQIILLQPLKNLFVYSYQINEDSFNKIQVICENNTQIIFSTTKTKTKIQNKNQVIRIYIYQSNGNNIKSNKQKLILKQQGKIKYNFTCKLKRGRYKIFIQQGSRKIHLLCNQQQQTAKQELKYETKQLALSLLARSEIKLSKLKQLYVNGNKIQDLSYIYQNPHGVK